MEARTIDHLTHAIRTALSRRELSRVAAGGTLAGLIASVLSSRWSLNPVDARKKSHKKRAKPKKKRRRGKNQPVISPGPATALAYQCPPPTEATISGDGIVRFAQTFVAERGGSLRQIQFSVKKGAGTSGDYVVQLLRVAGGKPSHNAIDVLAATTVPDSAVATSDDATVTATFAGPLLAAGGEYAVAFSRPGTGPGGAVPNIRKGDGGACGGKLFIADGAVAFVEAPAQDTIVSVFVE